MFGRSDVVRWEGYETQFKRSGFPDQIVPQFYSSPTTAGVHNSLEGFALDILHGEMILKQCDRYSPIHVTFDDDCNLISLLVPALHRACSELEGVLEKKENELTDIWKKRFAVVRIRCHWLLAGFYLWRSRITQVVGEAQMAEEEGIAFIEKTLNDFHSPYTQKEQVILTPHLVSPGRTEPHWKEISVASLTKYRDEIQASSVVSIAREKFQDMIAGIIRENLDKEMPNDVATDHAHAFAEIGETLFNRYRAKYGDIEAKHSELVADFLASHGNDIVPSSGEYEQKRSEQVTCLIPLEPVGFDELQTMSNPSILSMLIVCMNMKSTNQYNVMQLLLHLVFATKDMHEALIQQINDAKATRRGDVDDDFSDSDDDSMMSDASGDRKASNKNMDEKRAIQCGHFVSLLVDKIRYSFSRILSDIERKRFIADDSHNLIRCTLDLSSRWFETTAKSFSPEDLADLSIFQSVGALIPTFCESLSTIERKMVDTHYMEFLVKIMIRHRHILAGLVQNHGDRSTRTAKQRLCLKRAAYITSVAIEIGMLLSENLGNVNNLVLRPSDVVAGISKDDMTPTNSHQQSKAEWIYFIDSILWLWNYSSQNLVDNPGNGGTTPVCSPFDRPIIAYLRVPIAAAVVGICGAAAFSKFQSASPHDKIEDPLSLLEFYDSDASANDMLSDDEGQDEVQQKRKELLRVICHAVQCVSLVLDKIDDKGALSISSKIQCKGLGPLFPLVASRTLNHFADSLLRNFVDDSRDIPDLWSVGYPTASRTTGEILDSNLHKVYRWLHGFVLVGEKAHLQATGKDLASSTAPIVDLAVKDCKLENVAAAAQLYRCIVRAYSGGRRSPPKKALELVSNALPPLEDSEKSTTLRRFLFDTDGSYFSFEQISRLVTKEVEWDHPFSSIQKQLCINEDEARNSQQVASEEVEVVMRVRRGILSELAGGQLPLNGNENVKGKSDQTPDDDRLVAVKNEEEIAKKFDAIVDDLCLGDTTNSEGWYRAAQCLNTKAELIADRLGLRLGFARNKDFAIPSPQPRSVRGIELELLQQEQETEDTMLNSSCIHYFGDDLSLFAKFSWASFESLRAFADEIGRRCQGLTFSDGPNNGKLSQGAIWKRIESYYGNGDFLSWQEAWGGIFVFALRTLAVRFISVSLYLLQSKIVPTSEEKILQSELCESLGIILYTSLMGSQNYGYPMRPMGLKRKRDLARTARICFQAAVDVVVVPTKTDGASDEDHATWDLLFMVGKVS